MSMSNEDYLEAIVRLGGTTDTSIRSIDIAQHLDVSKASVNKAITVLRKRGYVDHPYYGGIVLTKEGYRYGSLILEHHRLLYRFLTEALGIEEKQAEKEACLMEHTISDESFKKWSDYINNLDL